MAARNAAKFSSIAHGSAPFPYILQVINRRDSLGCQTAQETVQSRKALTFGRVRRAQVVRVIAITSYLGTANSIATKGFLLEVLR